MKITLIAVLIGLLGFGIVYAQEHHGHDRKHVMGEETMHMGEESSGICPVMGGETTKENSYTYEGKTYYFCCPMCIEEFKKDPEKYISKIKEINLEAFQFGYSPELITVKKDDIVKIYATSRDVPHGIYIKAYNINRTVKKGERQKIEFIADKSGEFDIICSVYCGRGHHSMKAKLVVEE